MNMEIKVLGTGCAGCKALCETVRQAVAESGLDATVVKEEDIVKIMSYNVMNLPALVVDGRVVAQGRKLSLAEVRGLLTKCSAMKRSLLLAAAAAFVACGQGPAGKTAADRPQDDCVEVLCFHGAKRCATCMAIETGVKEVLETDFAGQVGAGEVRFRIIDVAKPENGALADKYEVAWSALLLNKWRDGKETVTDLTRFAFANARTNPERFKAELCAEIRKQLDM